MSKEKKQKIKNVNKLTFQQRIIKKQFEPIFKDCFDKACYINYCILYNYCKDNNYQFLELENYIKLVEIYSHNINHGIYTDCPISYDEFENLAYSDDDIIRES